jgi:multidrug resistance protein MdtO
MIQAAKIEEFLQIELAPRPGRLGDALRVTVLTVLVVIISETYQIPFTAYSAYIVFFISKEEAASTVLTAVLITIAVTLSVMESLGVYMISAGEPGLRLPLMAVVVFIGMFISRASPLGPVGFAIGFLATLSLTLIDSIPPIVPRPSADLLTRAALWIWVVAMLPISLVIIGNLLTGRDPFALFKDALVRRLELSGNVLARSETKTDGGFSAPLLKNLKMAGIYNKKRRAKKSQNRTMVARTGRLLVLLKEWVGVDVSEPALLTDAEDLAGFYRSAADAVRNEKEIPPYQGSSMISLNVKGNEKASLLVSKMRELTAGFAQEDSFSESGEPAEKTRLLFPDAFSNPDYFRYALKATLAIFVTYITYNLVDWPGIRTCMITCFFVTLGNFGETAQKMTLRITGALIGGALGLGAVVFIMPYITTITGLSILIATVAFFAAWIASSSEKLSYAGLQIAMAFLFCTLVGYGPSLELSESRDRVVGIIFGNVIVYLIFSQLWPVSAFHEVGKSLGSALTELSRLFSDAEVDSTFLKLDDALMQARRLTALDPFEPGSLKDRGVLAMNVALVEAVEALRAPALVLHDELTDFPRLENARRSYHRALSFWLSGIYDQIISDRTITSAPDVGPLIELLAADPERAAYASWYCVLDERVSDLASVIRDSLAQRAMPLEQEVRRAA